MLLKQVQQTSQRDGTVPYLQRSKSSPGIFCRIQFKRVKEEGEEELSLFTFVIPILHPEYLIPDYPTQVPAQCDWPQFFVSPRPRSGTSRLGSQVCFLSLNRGLREKRGSDDIRCIGKGCLANLGRDPRCLDLDNSQGAQQQTSPFICRLYKDMSTKYKRKLTKPGEQNPH